MSTSVSPGQSQKMPSAERFASSARTSAGEVVEMITKQVRRRGRQGQVAGQDTLTISPEVGDARDEQLLRDTEAGPAQYISKR